jgi:hypothetical protein
MKKQLLTLVAILIASITLAQTNGFNYKALIINNGNALASQSVDIRFTILQNGNTSVYQETQTASTDANGIVAVNVGEGTVISGDFSTIDWGANTHFLKVEINTGSGYTDFGTSELKSVPYAKFAEKAGNTFSGDFTDLTNVPTGLADGDDVNDADHNASNELQTISKNASNVVTLSNGGGSFTDADTHLTDTQITAMGYIKSANDADHDANNELQTISKNASNVVTLSNGGGSFTDADTHLSETQVDAMVANNGYATQLNDLSDAKRAGTAYYIGQDAGNAVSSNDRYNVGIGYEALINSTTADYTTAIGFHALFSNTTGGFNTANGSQALFSNTEGNYNTANGFWALFSNTTGGANTAIGSKALYSNTTGDYNTANGSSALYSNTTG